MLGDAKMSGFYLFFLKFRNCSLDSTIFSTKFRGACAGTKLLSDSHSKRRQGWVVHHLSVLIKMSLLCSNWVVIPFLSLNGIKPVDSQGNQF